MIAQVCEKTKYFGKETTKKILEKKLLDRYEKQRTKQCSKNLYYFDFFKTLKTNEDMSLKL